MMRPASFAQPFKRSRDREGAVAAVLGRSLRSRFGAIDRKSPVQGPRRTVRGTLAGLALMLLLSLPALAVVDGTVINKTTGKPAAGVTVRLTSLLQGVMKPIGRTESAADGSFKFDVPSEGMFLVQANWQGVQYSQNLPPMARKSGVEMAIWDVKPKLEAAKASQHIVFLESDGQNLIASEMIIYENGSQLTWYDAKRGTAKFYLPPGIKPEDVKANVTAPGGLPLERELTASGEPGVYSVDYPVKPGESRFEISYTAPKLAEFSGTHPPARRAFSSRGSHWYGSQRRGPSTDRQGAPDRRRDLRSEKALFPRHRHRRGQPARRAGRRWNARRHARPTGRGRAARGIHRTARL